MRRRRDVGISSPFSRLVNWPIVFGMACVMLCEGFDLIIYSSLIPPLIGDADMGVDKAAAGFIGSMTFLGMFFGGISAGAVKRRLGYVRTIAFGVIWFSLAVAAAAFAPSGAVLGALRALAGLGLGVVLPVAMSLARAYSTRRMSALVISIVMTGIPFGGLMAAFLCAALLSVFGWRPLMFVAGLIGLVLLAFIMPFVAKQVEQSPRLSRTARSNGHPTAPVRFEGRALFRLCLLALTTFLFLMAYYGISTWLAQLMREFNLPLENSLQMMVVLNFGCVLGSLVTAWLATKVSAKGVAMTSAALATLCLLGVAARPEGSVALVVLVFFAGVGAISAQNLTNALVSNAFPEESRSAALGFTLGFGRLGAVASPAAGGLILQLGLDPAYVLAMLACADMLGAAALLLYAPYRAKSQAARPSFSDGAA